MSEQPLISLLVPCYNVANVCDRFFMSLLDQDYTNIQLILVNDGSTDDTEKKLFSYKEDLENKGYIFDYIYQDNKGVGGATNTGLKKINGDLFCWADPDDYYEKNAFKKRVEYFENHPECMALTCNANTRHSDDISKITGRECDFIIHHKESKQFMHLLNYDSLICTGTHMIRTAALRKAVPELDIYESRYGQNIQILLPLYYCFDRHTLPDIVYNYIVYENSLSHNEKDYTKKKRRIEENEIIYMETLKRIDMPVDERGGYINFVKAFHNKLRMYNARAFSDKETYLKLYKELKAAGEIDFKDMLRRIRFLLTGK